MMRSPSSTRLKSVIARVVFLAIRASSGLRYPTRRLYCRSAVIIGEETRRLVLVSALYTALTFVMAYPLSASPGSTVVWDAPDTHVYLWTLAWDAYAFLHQPLLIFDANIYYPFTNTLAYSENLIGTV